MTSQERLLNPVAPVSAPKAQKEDGYHQRSAETLHVRAKLMMPRAQAISGPTSPTWVDQSGADLIV